MVSGGNVEGYLLKIDDNHVRIIYCILDEGILQYFSHKGGVLLGAVPLTGSKVEVFLMPNEKNKIPHQFRVDTQLKMNRKRGSGIPSSAQIVAAQHQQTKTHLLLAGATKELMDQWAISILNWSRYSWEDSHTLCSSKDEFETLKDIVKHSDMILQTEIPVPLGVSRAVQPL